jgi:spore germination protein GerM
VTRAARPTALAAVVLLWLAGGCGLSEDSSPQAIAPADLPPELLDPSSGTSSTAQESPGTTPAAVYFLEEVADRTRLVEVERPVHDAESPGERVTALLSQQPDASEGFTTSVPADTMLLRVDERRETDELVLHLSGELFDVQGEGLANAFAQIVWTATEPDAGGWTRVRFVVDGRPIRALDANGAEQEGAVTRANYRALAPR